MFRRIVLNVLLCIVLVGCIPAISERTPTLVNSCQGACTATATLLPTSTATTRPPLLRCDDGQFALPEELIKSGSREDYYDFDHELLRTHPGGLSIQIDVSESTVLFEKPILLEISISNDTEQPITFVRPQAIAFQNDPIRLENSFIAKMVDPKGESIKTQYAEMPAMPYYSPTAKEFTTLPGGAKCSVPLEIDWKKQNLSKPLSPGQYQISGYLSLAGRGPLVNEATTDIMDIGAWLGKTKESNTVTFTIIAPVR